VLPAYGAISYAACAVQFFMHSVLGLPSWFVLLGVAAGGLWKDNSMHSSMGQM
jgi:hypothetical protein